MAQAVAQSSSVKVSQAPAQSSNSFGENDVNFMQVTPRIWSTPVEKDPYLRQLVSMLQTYWNNMREITDQDLILLRKYTPQVIIENYIYVKIEWTVMINEKGPSRHSSGGKGTAQVKTIEEALTLVEFVSVYNHKLEKVVQQILETEEELKKTDCSLSRKLSKLTELKKSLDQFSRVVDRIQKFYSAKCMGFAAHDRPSLEEFKCVKEQICRINKHLKQKELSSLFSMYNKEFITTDESILCGILGVTEDFAESLVSMDEETRNHQSVLYYLERFIENRENEAIMAGAVGEDLISNLKSLGFTHERAQDIKESIPVEFVDLQTPAFWAKRYLEYAFCHHPLLSNCPRYPFPENDYDTFFTKNMPVDNRCEPEDSQASQESVWKVNMISVSNADVGNSKIDEFLQRQGDTDFQLLYHGTSHQGACSILKQGITLERGSDAQDFSSGDGFYLSESFENARKWAQAGRGEQQAVVVFKVKKDLLDEEKENGLDLTADMEDWKNIVHLCRQEYADKKMKKKLLTGVDFVRGPVCSNPKDICDVVSARNIEIITRREDEFQVCVRDEDYAERLGSIENICCAIFY